MQNEIARMVLDFEHGRLSRRQLIAHLAGIIAAAAGARKRPGSIRCSKTGRGGHDFQAVALDHIALSVRDVQRSQQWYQKHLGLKPMGQEGFITTGKGWLALFQGESRVCTTTAIALRITIRMMPRKDSRPLA